MGPMERRLNNFGQIRSLVIGPRGEGSKDIHRLINMTSEIAAEHRWREMGARSVDEARIVFRGRMRRSIGITAVREAAKLKRERLGIVLGDGKAAETRRRWGAHFSRKMQEEYYACFGCGPRY